MAHPVVEQQSRRRDGEEGLVTALTPGKTTIRATGNDGSGKFALCVVTVTGSDVTSNELSKTYLQLDAGEKRAVSCEVLPRPRRTGRSRTGLQQRRRDGGRLRARVTR
jgi:hypothetical protein